MEIWKDVMNFPGYQISSEGRVKSLERKVRCGDGRLQPCKGKMLSLQTKTGRKGKLVYFRRGVTSYQRSVHILMKTHFGVENWQQRT